MTDSVAARLDVKMRKSNTSPSSFLRCCILIPLGTGDIPESIFRQMRTCQTAANEFLRQFWLAIYPPPSDLQIVSTTTPAQKAAKAAKMIGYLEKTHEKVNAIVRASSQEGADAVRVKTVKLL